jgi:UDP-N-acetylmuramoyl-tripeptide--D-alanyl-D-alanine ligase
MIPTTLRQVADAVDGTLHDGADSAALVTGLVSVDSRSVEPGGLFVAVVGERVDGHDYAAAAVHEGGATAALGARRVGAPCVVVADPVVALGLLARSVLDRTPGCTVVGITGSAGKTSAKDLLASVLSSAMPTVASVGNNNNEIGLPLTVLRLTEESRVLVAELGSRGLGHISALTRIAPPRIGVVLNVGSAHLGEYGSVEVTAQAKGELVEALPPAAEGGIAVLNADDPRVRAMASRTSARVVLAGRAADADVRAEHVRLLAGAHPAFTLTTPEGSAPVALGYVGEHHVANALAAAAVGRELGLTVEAVAAALSLASPRSRWRMEVVERGDGVTVINDTYNASPDSVRAALRALVGLAGGRRTWAVLGEMLELGDARIEEHDAIGRLVGRLDVDRLVVVGEDARPIDTGANRERAWAEPPVVVPDADSAVALLERELRGHDVVLVKASRSIGLERVVAALLSDQGVRS